MPPELRKTGISVVGDIPWGTHFCYFYETQQDLLDTLLPYFKTGLENKEFCLWVISNSELLTIEEAKAALREAVPDLDRYLSDGSIDLVSHDEWFLDGGAFDLHRVANRFKERLDEALARGYVGMRVNGSPAWLQRKDAEGLRQFEEEVDRLFPKELIIASCTYPLATIRGIDIFDIVRRHQFAIARRSGEWEVVETPELTQAKAEIKRLNEELEQRIFDRTRELVAANESLKSEIDERSRMEQELQERAADLAEAQRVAKLGNWIFNLRTNKVSWSDELYRIFEIEKPDFDGSYESFVSLIHPYDQLRVLATNAQARTKGSPFDIEYRIITTNAEVRIIREVGYAAQDEAGTVIRLFGTAQDITERKQAEDELRRQKEILQQIFDHIPVMISFVDAEGRILLVNREWERTLGWSLDEIRRQNLDIFVECYPDLQYRQQVLKFVAEAKGEWADFRTRVKGGLVIDTTWVRVQLTDGTKIGIGQNITERKRAEEKLRQAETELRLVVDTIPTQVASTLPDGSLDLVNERWQEYFGLSLKEAQGGGLKEVIHPEDRAEYLVHWQTALVTGEPFEREARLRRADGQYRWVLSRTVPLRNEVGTITKWYGTGIDIEDRKRAEEHLKATSEQLRALSARLSSAREEEGTRIARELHDELGSALTSLRWDLEGIDKLCSESGDQVDSSQVRENIKGLLGLIDATINTVVRISTELRPSILDDLGLVAAIEWQAQQFQARTGIVCRFDSFLEDPGLSREQTTAVFRILQEALTNILRHSQATRVNIMLEERHGDLVLEVKDNGKGITEEERSGPRSLGLIGMRERAQLAGGRIEIIGATGKGTVLTLRVPINGPAADDG